MKLLKMILENFKGIQHCHFNFGGYDANIYGANGVGKTTIYDAFTWLMFGRSSEERSNFTPKTISADGYVHNLCHSVECDIEINGETVTFKRSYHEVYKKSRGNKDAVLSGHTTDYWINGTPMKEKEYTRYWEGIFPNDEVVKLLTIPNYFSEQLHWEKRRGILLEVCGDVSDVAIMETDTELSELSSKIGRQTVDEFKKTLRARRTEINKQIEMIPARIDEATKAIPDTNGLSESGIEFALADVRGKISEAEKERADLLANNDNTSKCKVKLAELNYQLTDQRRKFAEKISAASSDLFNALQTARGELSNAEISLSENKSLLSEAKQKVVEITRKRNEIMDSYRSVQEKYSKCKDEIFDESSTVCDKCGQELPEGKISELRRIFSENKEENLKILKSKATLLLECGKTEASKEMLAAAQDRVSELEKAIFDAESIIPSLKEKLNDIQKKYDGAIADQPKFEDTEEYAETIRLIELAKSEEKELEPDTSDIDARILGYRQTENDLNNMKSALETEKVQRERIASLEAEEKELGKKFEETEYCLYLCDKFIRVKSSLLNDKINEMFRTVRFQLFRQNITNDGIDDICDVLVPSDSGASIPFSDANKAARLNAGIEIIGVLGNHYGIELPIFVDNAESVSHIVPTSGQLIRLVVSEKDDKLRLETL